MSYTDKVLFFPMFFTKEQVCLSLIYSRVPQLWVFKKILIDKMRWLLPVSILGCGISVIITYWFLHIKLEGKFARMLIYKILKHFITLCRKWLGYFSEAHRGKTIFCFMGFLNSNFCADSGLKKKFMRYFNNTSLV